MPEKTEEEISEQEQIEELKEASNLLSNFAKEMRTSINDLKEVSVSDTCSIKDERTGLKVSFQSKRYNVEQLANLSIQTLNYLHQRKPKDKPAGVD